MSHWQHATHALALLALISPNVISRTVARIRALALKNIELHRADFTKLELGSDQFDDLIGHGVFSWVPKQAQDGTFRICAEALVPNGVAVVSVTTCCLVGTFENIILDICLHHVGLNDPPRTRVANARKARDLIAGSTKTKPNGLLIRDEARRLASRPAAYIMGEFIAALNAPRYFVTSLSSDCTNVAPRRQSGAKCSSPIHCQGPRGSIEAGTGGPQQNWRWQLVIISRVPYFNWRARRL